MNFDNFDKAIQQAETELDKVRQKTEEIVAEFKKIIPEFISGWATYLVDSYITKHTDTVKDLGIQKIGLFKKKLLKFNQTLPNTAEERLEAIKWVHRFDIPQNENDSNSPHSYELNKHANLALDEIIRELIGQVGALLIEYGFTKAGQNAEWQIRSDKVYYSYGIPDQPWILKGPDLRRVKEKYGKALEEYVESLKALKKAENDKAIAEAKNIWDQA